MPCDNQFEGLKNQAEYPRTSTRSKENDNIYSFDEEKLATYFIAGGHNSFFIPESMELYGLNKK